MARDTPFNRGPTDNVKLKLTTRKQRLKGPLRATSTMRVSIMRGVNFFYKNYFKVK